MFAVDSKCFFVFPSFFCVFCFDMEKPQKNIVFYFFERIWSIKISFFWGFQHFRFGFLHWTVSKNKETMSSFVFWYLDWSYPFRKPNKPKVLFWVFHFKTKKQQTTEGTPKKTSFGSKPNILSFFWFLLEFFVFFVLSIISHDCHLCPYVCLPYRSWEVKLWPTFLTFSHPRACALCETKLGIGFAVMIMWW